MAELRVLHKVETVSERVRRLQAEAKQAARDHVALFARQMVDLQFLAIEIADGGEAYPPGVRDVARRLAEELDSRSQTLAAISNRT